jgi:hypothetical protein
MRLSSIKPDRSDTQLIYWCIIIAILYLGFYEIKFLINYLFFNDFYEIIVVVGMDEGLLYCSRVVLLANSL